MKIFSLHKQLPCLFVFLFIGIISVFGLSGVLPLVAAVIEDFPPTDFFEVDHTTPEYTKYGNIQYNPKGIVGYYSRGGNVYKLTDTIYHMTVAMWNKHKLDMNQDWEFKAKLFFDTGSYKTNIGRKVKTNSRRIADGICFVLHNQDSMRNLIGDEQAGIGYGGISPSFAVEFDTEDNGNHDEGWETIDNRSGCHIAYLRDGVMTPIKEHPNYVQMQHEWRTVALGEWLEVRIVWSKKYEKGVPYYELTTYMEEKNPTSSQVGQVLSRCTQIFKKLSDVITGLEVDSNCQALVNWGITSAACDNGANHQEIEFQQLAMTEPEVTDSVTIGFYNTFGNYQPPTMPQPESVQFLATIPNKPIKLFSGGISCGAPANLPDTIQNLRQGCLPTIEHYNNNHLIFWGVDMSDAKWYINDSLVQTSTTIIDTARLQYSFNMTDYKDLYEDSTYLIVKAVVNETDYVFKFAVNENPELAAQLAQALNIQLDTANPNTLNLNINSTSLAQTIQLPEIGGCSDGQRWRQHIQSMQPDSLSPFAVLPQIDSNNVLTFELKTDTCSANIYIELLCECNAQFTLAVNNTICNESCDAVTFTETNRGTTDNFINNKILITYEVTTTPQSSNVTTITANKLTSSHDAINLETYKRVPLNGTNPWLQVILSGDVRDTIDVQYEVCATLEGGTICCDTFEFHDYFNGKGPILCDVQVGADRMLRAEVDLVGLSELQPSAPKPGRGGAGGQTGTGNSGVATIADIPIKITLRDFHGNLIAVLVDETMMGTSKIAYYDTNSLVSGYYYVVFRLGGDDGYIKSIVIIIGGGR